MAESPNRPTLVGIGAHPRARGGFTLTEVLIAIAILGILVALLLPGIRGAVQSARSFKCTASMRTLAFDFTVFADDTLHPWRGEDDSSDAAERVVPLRHFRLETFVESQYGLDEFWQNGTVQAIRLPDAQGRDPMRCPEVRGELVLRRGVPCSQGAVSPSANVSYGFNIRLHQSDALWRRGLSTPVALNSAIISGNGRTSPSTIPLAIDVDGAAAGRMGAVPLFTGPTLNSVLFARDRVWFPGMRHGRAANAAFLDGHVAQSAKPLEERNWDWSFDAGE